MTATVQKEPRRQTHKRNILRGLAIYKQNNSRFWFARIWNANTKKYVIKSTRETVRTDAEEAAVELFHALKTNSPPVDKKVQFNQFAERLDRNQDRLAGTQRSGRYSRDDRILLDRKEDGLLAYFGNWDVNEITTSSIQEYLDHLDDRREKPLASSTKNKHAILIRKVLRVAYDDRILQTLPLAPKIPKADRPRASFTEDEYKVFLETIRDAVQKEIKVGGHLLTMEFYYFCLWIVHNFLRPTVPECFQLTFNDVEVVDEAGRPKHIKCFVKGKTGYRKTTSTEAAVDFFHHMKTKIHPEHQSSDFIFLPHIKNRQYAWRVMRQFFEYVVEVANLKVHRTTGQNRTLYSLRHYGIEIRILKSKGKVNLFGLAQSAGTSVDVIERFYVRWLGLPDEMVENLQSFG